MCFLTLFFRKQVKKNGLRTFATAAVVKDDKNKTKHPVYPDDFPINNYWRVFRHRENISFDQLKQAGSREIQVIVGNLDKFYSIMKATQALGILV